MKALTEREVEVLTERYYKVRVKHDKIVEDNLTKYQLITEEKEERKVLTENELEKRGLGKYEEEKFKEEISKIEKEILIFGRKISKLCFRGIRKADYLIELYPGYFLLEQEEIKVNLKKIVHYFDDLSLRKGKN